MTRSWNFPWKMIYSVLLPVDLRTDSFDIAGICGWLDDDAQSKTEDS
jgi:hypothetical protein